MQLQQVVPWGRSFDEYQAMFMLSGSDLQKSILGCSDGPASFNAELTLRGGKVISADPVYQFTAEQIQSRIEAAYPEVITQVSANRDDFVWTEIKSVEDLGQIRRRAMQRFLHDYEQGKDEGRYINAALPDLPFSDQQFDLALCSNFLFLYSEHLDEPTHLISVLELCRVAKEVRIYPLLTLDNTPSPYLHAVTAMLAQHSLTAELREVEYEFQRGAKQMLVISRSGV